MPKLSVATTVQPEVEQTVKLTNKQELQLRTALRKYELLKKKLKQIKADMEEETGKVEDVMADVGVEALAYNGFKTKIVAGTRQTFDPKKFILKGGNIKIYNESMVEKPVKAYVKISTPKEDDEDED